MIALVRPGLTEAALCAWVGQAYPGEQLVYHRGLLAIDVDPNGVRLTQTDRLELRRLANRAFWLFEHGALDLLQRREQNGDYIYIAIARRRPRLVRTAAE